MNEASVEVARSVTRRIYLLLVLTVVGGVMAFLVTPPALLERRRSDQQFITRQQDIRDHMNDLERLALAAYLGATHGTSNDARAPSDLLGELTLNSRRAMETELVEVTAMVRIDHTSLSEPLIHRLRDGTAAFLEQPASDAGLERLLLAIDQMRHASVRATELYVEGEANKVQRSEQLVRGLMLALLGGVALAGAYIVRSSKRTVRHLANTITERDERAQALRREHDFATSLTDTAPAIILILDPAGAIAHVNPFFEQLTGWRREEILGRDWFATFIPERERQRTAGLFSAATAGVPVRGNVNAILTRGGEEREIEWHSHTQTDAEGHTTGVLNVGVDVTERNRAEAAIRRALQEKETLLREIHHRVKNNLQIISSLLHFQAKKVHDASAARVFEEARERLRSMTLVHEKLYNSRDLSAVEFAGYVKALVDQFAQSTDAGRRIRFQVETVPVMLPIASALPCGMILVELLTNVIKYAFPDGHGGEARIELAMIGGHVRVTVADSGAGLPVGFDPATTRSFGWQLICSLTTQLDGVVDVVREGGTRVIISFPNTATP